MNREVILKTRPQGLPTQANFSLRNQELKNLKDGEVLLATKYLTVDPYMRGRMNDRPSYVPPFKVNEPLSGGVVAEVVESKYKNLQPKDMVYGMLPWSTYSIAEGCTLRKLDPSLAPVSTALGILGMPGMTAYFGLLDIGKPQKDETVVISGAAGAVGSLVGQIAKIKGARVVGIAGSDEKVDYLTKELKFDAAVNYKLANFQEALMQACPNGVDVYFDNVGGETSQIK